MTLVAYTQNTLRLKQLNTVYRHSAWRRLSVVNLNEGSAITIVPHYSLSLSLRISLSPSLPLTVRTHRIYF